jgi:hypothetical protein
MLFFSASLNRNKLNDRSKHRDMPLKPRQMWKFTCGQHSSHRTRAYYNVFVISEIEKFVLAEDVSEFFYTTTVDSTWVSHAPPPHHCTQCTNCTLNMKKSRRRRYLPIHGLIGHVRTTKNSLLKLINPSQFWNFQRRNAIV